MTKEMIELICANLSIQYKKVDANAIAIGSDTTMLNEVQMIVPKKSTHKKSRLVRRRPFSLYQNQFISASYHL